MQVTETANDGLKRELKVVVNAEELDGKLSERLEDLKDKVQIKGFRPGKVPVNHLRKMYGRSVMAEVLQEAVSETSRAALTEREERPAFEPEIALTEDKDEIDQIMDGKADLAYTMSFEILPDIELQDLSKLKLEKHIAEVDEKEHENGLKQVLEGNIDYADVDREAKLDDRLKIDFTGTIGGEKFEGGAAEDASITLGQGQFIPGFEEGLIGVKNGDEKTIKVTFPSDYPVDELKDKEADFAIVVKEVAEPKTPELNDEFATKLGFDSIDKLKETVKEKLQNELDQVSRNKLKKELLDELEENHKFALPEKLINDEFDAIWSQQTAEMAQKNQTFEDQGTTEEERQKEFRKIAERRVRLGLIVSEIGRANDINVTDEEVQQALINKASQFPGQERQVLSFYQQNTQALAELRAPLYEEKVVNYILELADVKEKKVSFDELTKADQDDEEDKQADKE